MKIVLNNSEEMKKYYDEKTNTYLLKENGVYYEKVIFAFDVNVKSVIIARDIKAHNIIAKCLLVDNIEACTIEAQEVTALNIDASDIKVKDISALVINCYNIISSFIYVRDLNAVMVKSYNIYVKNITSNKMMYSESCVINERMECNIIEVF